MVPLQLGALGAAYYTANAHKWLCAPKGAAILVVRRDRRDAVHPTNISHGFEPDLGRARFREEFDWTGTIDPTAWLALPECIRYLGSLLDGGWPALMARNRALALRARAAVGRALGVAPPCPEGMVGSMASLPLPAAVPGTPAADLDHEALSHWLRGRAIEGWFNPWPCPGGKVTRLSAQLYNDDAQYEILAAALAEAVLGRRSTSACGG
jgi:isopenicillin-N epimerase